MLFDALNRVTEITHLDTVDSPLATLIYTLDPTGRRTNIAEGNGRQSSYAYDDLYRLTGETIIDTENGAHNASYAYNAVSNRTQATVNGVTTSYIYDDNDRLLFKGSDSYTYDDNGNTTAEVIEGQSNSYSYDSRNRLIEANIDGNSQFMAYDPDGARIEKSGNFGTTDYLVDSNRHYAQVLHESTAGTELAYTFGTDLVGLNTGTERYTYHSDALGSTRILTNGSGQVADDIRYDAWGDKLSGGDVVKNQYLYTGEQFDVGLDKLYLRARYYAQDVGRFSQMDTWSGSAGNPSSLHKYQYALSDPKNFTDPSGRISFSSISAALHAGSRLALTVSRGAASNLVGFSRALKSRSVKGISNVSLNATKAFARIAAQARVLRFKVPKKHLSTAGGRWSKFAEGVNPHLVIFRALRSGAKIQVNGEKSFFIVGNVGRIVVTKGETYIKVVFGKGGKIWTAFPKKGP